MLRNVAYLGMAEAGIRVASVISFVVVSRTVGPVSLGYLSFAMALIAYAGVLGDGGLTMYTQRQIAGGLTDVHRAVTATTAVQLILACTVGGLVLAFVLLASIPGPVAPLVIVQIPLLLAQALSLTYVLQGQERMNWVALIRVIGQGSVVVLTIGLVVATRDVVWAAVAYWAGSLVGDAACIALLWYRRLYRPAAFDPRMVVDLLRSGLPFLGIAFATQLFANMDIVVLGVLRSGHDVGVYSAALRIAQLGLYAMAIMSTVAFPRFSRHFVNDRPRFTSLLERLLALTERGALAASAFVFIEAPAIVQLLFGDQFQESGRILQILMLWIPLGFYSTMVGQALLGGGHQKTYLGAVVLASGTFMLMLVTVVPWIGAPGAAAAVVGREVVVFALFTAAAYRQLGQNTLSIFVKQMPYLVLPLGACWLLGSVVPAPSLLLAAAVWLASVVAVEGALGWPTLRTLATPGEIGGSTS